MSDKSNRSKILLLIFLAFTTSCQRQIYNSEVICPFNGAKILVKYARADEMRTAMKRALSDKKKYNTSETYTVIRLPGNRSFKIEKIAPEEIVNCNVVETPIGVKDRDYILYFGK